MVERGKDDPAKDEKFKKVVQHFLNTPPKPHAPKGGKKKGDDSRRSEKDGRK